MAKEKQKQAVDIVEKLADGIVILDEEGKIRFANPAACRLFGRTEEELLGFDFGRPSVEGEMAEVDIPRKDGALVSVELRTHPVKWDGKDMRLVSLRDVSERKDAQEALKRIEWMLSHSFQSSIEEKEAAEQDYGDLTKLNRRGLILHSVEREMLTRIASDYLDLLGTSSAIYEANGDYAYGIFASGWCRMMDRASRELCDTPDNAEALACGRWHCHESCWNNCSKVAMERGEPVDVKCAGGIRLYGMPVFANGEVIGAINFGYGDPPRSTEKLKKLARTYQLKYEDLRRAAEEYKTRPPYIIEMAKSRLRTSAQTIGLLVERKQAEEEIAESRRMAQSTIDSLNANICVLDERGNIISVNESWREFAQANGATPAKTCEGTNYLEVCGSVQGENRDMALEFAEGIRGVMRGETDCFEREYPCHSPDQKRWFNGSVTPIRDGENGLNRVVIAHMDITERKRLTNDLLRAEKLAAVGELVAGVAHEIKNPLNTMMGFAQLLLVREEELEEGVKKDIQKMHGAARRVDRITDGLLNFARKGQEEKSRVDINEVLMETLELKKDHLESRHIKVDKKLAPEMPPVTASKDQMEQVFLNLINNAEYFMSEKDGAGILTLRTSLAEEKIKIEILDSGPGIPEGILDDLFSPFFTGKPEGEGTGLGLSVSYGIVEEHGGRLEAANREEGEGAVFSVILPLKT